MSTEVREPLIEECESRIQKARKTGADRLDLNELGLTAWPRSLADMPQLRTLLIAGNQISRVPSTISTLPSLLTLDISVNRIKNLPEALGDLKALRWLNVSYNLLETLPDSIGKMTGLVDLDLAFNQIEQFPAGVDTLRYLTSLSLSANKLTQVPESIGLFPRLRVLKLADNQLRTLPDSIGQLRVLEHLDVTNNRLADLPSSIALLDLSEFYLHNNPELGIPPEILGPSVKSTAAGADPAIIIDYYKRILIAGKPLNEAKLILVGRGGVGKTSIVNRIVAGTFDPAERKTDGIRITDWSFLLNSSEQVRLNVWDFGGQEIMHATHQFFLSQRSLYLLILSGREGTADSDAEYWLKMIESFGAGSPVIVVLNKMREHPFDLNRRGLQAKYPSVRMFVETDCNEGLGIPELRKVIEAETDQLEHLRDAFPSSWFAIKNRIARMRENFVSFERFRDICAQAGETDIQSQDRLAHYLHILGIALNYKEDARLRDTHVLNPHWVTNGIYKILNSDLLASARGELGLDDLSRILDLQEYPVQKHPFLIDLMKKFDLCFEFPGIANRFLIPELLNKDEPEDLSEFETEDSLRFQYNYSVLPEGILPRFIVRTQSMSVDRARWRTGVVLGFEQCIALVKADLQDKRVFVSVVGTAEGRRRLLAIIRSDLGRIHAQFSKLDVQEMVPIPGRHGIAVPYKSLVIRENKGLPTVEIDTHDDVLVLPVEPLLNGVDLAEERRNRKVPDATTPLRLFFSYAHEDESLRDSLETRLKLLQRERVIEVWHDRKILAGEKWAGRIDDEMQKADIVVPLLSADFIASDYCWEVETKIALDRQRQGLARIIPVILRPCEWQRTPFARIQSVPTDGVPVSEFADRDAAWLQVTNAVRKAAESMRSQLSNR